MNIVSSLIWKFLERGGVQVTQFIVSIIIARLLVPADYGAVALLMIFISIATVFVQSGLNTALVQKKDADEVDITSVFYYSIGLSAIIYLCLFLCAECIADFYGMPDVIINGETGILIENPSDFCSAVVKLLLDDELNVCYGKAAKSFVQKQFNPQIIAEKWHNLFVDTKNKLYPPYQRPTCNYRNNYKYLRLLNRNLRKIPYLSWLPSIALIECKIKSILVFLGK